MSLVRIQNLDSRSIETQSIVRWHAIVNIRETIDQFEIALINDYYKYKALSLFKFFFGEFKYFLSYKKIVVTRQYYC